MTTTIMYISMYCLLFIMHLVSLIWSRLWGFCFSCFKWMTLNAARLSFCVEIAFFGFAPRSKIKEEIQRIFFPFLQNHISTLFEQCTLDLMAILQYTKTKIGTLHWLGLSSKQGPLIMPEIGRLQIRDLQNLTAVSSQITNHQYPWKK